MPPSSRLQPFHCQCDPHANAHSKRGLVQVELGRVVGDDLSLPVLGFLLLQRQGGVQHARGARVAADEEESAGLA
eukprot:CAMPEP_0181205802 /NCGR_PEP_ID=MMETSP1096-20121128/20675_1 /TAXON_ID=156174 ORGANISM="Chrysochromulina ericina, Strain CCMP281" /NCGR_SAMPLE_ID=MMETSP1096 /ASSEMBLY_ACC=CAM_ASM_000453 /LENGTH=74 /DNA_ID=CAMNT_0023296617 /DNA_START=304 /DNA_END=531 /DNA_ORIENTATION=-